MQPSGVELILTGFGIVASLGGLIVIVHKTVSASIQMKFAEAKTLITRHEEKLDKHLTNIYEQLRDMNNRVGKAEVKIANNKEDIDEHKKAIADLREDPRRGQGCL